MFTFVIHAAHNQQKPLWFMCCSSQAKGARGRIKPQDKHQMVLVWISTKQRTCSGMAGRSPVREGRQDTRRSGNCTALPSGCSARLPQETPGRRPALPKPAAVLQHFAPLVSTNTTALQLQGLALTGTAWQISPGRGNSDLRKARPWSLASPFTFA